MKNVGTIVGVVLLVLLVLLLLGGAGMMGFGGMGMGPGMMGGGYGGMMGGGLGFNPLGLIRSLVLLRVPSEMDGHPRDALWPGKSYVYDLEIRLGRRRLPQVAPKEGNPLF